MSDDPKNVVSLSDRKRHIHLQTALTLKFRFELLAEAMLAEGYDRDDVFYAVLRCACWMEPSKDELLADVHFLADHWYIPMPDEE
jgi:hypothetical protein